MKVEIREAKPGMKLCSPVYTRDNNLLVDNGSVLTSHLIDLLDLWGVMDIEVEETIVAVKEEPAKPVFDAEMHSFQKQRIKDLGLWIKKEAKRMLTSLDQPRSGLDGERLKHVAASIVDESTKTRDIMLSLTTIMDYDTYLFAHAVHVSILSVITGLALGVTRKELYSLAYGGLLADLGMMRIDRRIWLKKTQLTDEEFETVKQHPIYGVKEAGQLLAKDGDAQKIVLQHHERMDASGYPNRLRGRLIHPLARITAVCDVYEAMQADRTYRKKWLPYQVMSHLLVSSTETLDADVVKAFLRTMSAYPIGSFVRLDSGEVGVVVSTNPASPIRPVVKVFVSAAGEKMARPAFVELSADKRFIIGPIDPKQVGVEPYEVF